MIQNTYSEDDFHYDIFMGVLGNEEERPESLRGLTMEDFKYIRGDKYQEPTRRFKYSLKGELNVLARFIKESYPYDPKNPKAADAIVQFIQDELQERGISVYDVKSKKKPRINLGFLSAMVRAINVKDEKFVISKFVNGKYTDLRLAKVEPLITPKSDILTPDAGEQEAREARITKKNKENDYMENAAIFTTGSVVCAIYCLLILLSSVRTYNPDFVAACIFLTIAVAFALAAVVYRLCYSHSKNSPLAEEKNMDLVLNQEPQKEVNRTEQDLLTTEGFTEKESKFTEKSNDTPEGKNLVELDGVLKSNSNGVLV